MAVDTALLQTGLTAGAALLIGTAALGAGWTLIAQGRRTAQLRSRLAGDAPEGKRAAKPAAPLAAVVSGVKRLGDGAVLRDPNQVSALRFKLMQAGWASREAVPIFLGAKLACLVAAAGVLVVALPFLLKSGGGMQAAMGSGIFSLLAILGPEQVLKARRTKAAGRVPPGLSRHAGPSGRVGGGRPQPGRRRQPGVGRDGASLPQPGRAHDPAHARTARRPLAQGGLVRLADRLGIDEARGLGRHAAPSRGDGHQPGRDPGRLRRRHASEADAARRGEGAGAPRQADPALDPVHLPLPDRRADAPAGIRLAQSLGSG
jgi:hypothetical protein